MLVQHFHFLQCIEYGQFGEIEGRNPAGNCLAKLVENSNLYPVSLTDICTGPGYTYHSGDHFTTVDYIIAGASFAPYISWCRTLELSPCENVSDHLPISAGIDVSVVTSFPSTSTAPVDWVEAVKSGQIREYVEGTVWMLFFGHRLIVQ